MRRLRQTMDNDLLRLGNGPVRARTDLGRARTRRVRARTGLVRTRTWSVRTRTWSVRTRTWLVRARTWSVQARTKPVRADTPQVAPGRRVCRARRRRSGEMGAPSGFRRSAQRLKAGNDSRLSLIPPALSRRKAIVVRLASSDNCIELPVAIAAKSGH
jgi:hypothetical protein